MNPQESSKRRSSSVLTEEPTKKKVAEERKEQEDASSSGDEEDYSDEEEDNSPDYWDNIGDNEEMYLAGSREELYELIMRRENFEHKVKRKKAEELMGLTRSLLTYSLENIEELQLAQLEEEEMNPDERSTIGGFTALISFQHRRLTWLVETLFERYEKRRAEVGRRLQIIEVLKKEKVQLSKNLEKKTRERDELLGKVDSRKAEVEKRDASVSTEAEVPEVNMEEEVSVPSSSIQGIPPNLVGALETIIKRKFGELLSRVGLSADKNRENTPKATETWAQAVGRKERSAPPPMRSVATTGSSKGRVRQLPAHAKARGTISTPQGVVSNATAKEKGDKGKRKAWPTLPKTAAVAVNPLPGGNCSGAEFIKEAREKVSLEELGIPPPGS